MGKAVLETKMRKSSIVLFDRGLGSRKVFEQLTERGIFFIRRLPGRYKMKVLFEDTSFSQRKNTNVIKEREKRYATSALEYGATAILRHVGKPIEEALGKYFGKDAKVIYTSALLRTVGHCALKHLKPLYMDSYLSFLYPDLPVGPNQLSQLFRSIGKKREAILSFFRHFLTDQPHILFDATSLHSHAKQLEIRERGYSSKSFFGRQTNLLYMFSLNTRQPCYYRVVPGNIGEVSAFRLCLEELKTTQAVVVADKGFVSKSNVKVLEEEGLRYVLPLRRNNAEIDYNGLGPVDHSIMKNSFMFKNRCIWYKTSHSATYGKLFLFYEGSLAESKRQDYMARVHREVEGYNLDDFQSKQQRFGSLTLVTNIEESLSAEQVYSYYKGRMGIEKMFDVFKNALDADRTYMRGREELETWLFINHISLMLYYSLYERLQKADLLKKYAPMDVLRYGKQIRKIKIKATRYTSEVSSKMRNILIKIDIPIT